MILKGVPSGDLECWCFLVDKKTFTEIKGRAPGQFDVGHRIPKKSPYRYKLSPVDIFDTYDRSLQDKVVVLSADMEIA